MRSASAFFIVRTPMDLHGEPAFCGACEDGSTRRTGFLLSGRRWICTASRPSVVRARTGLRVAPAFC